MIQQTVILTETMRIHSTPNGPFKMMVMSNRVCCYIVNKLLFLFRLFLHKNLMTKLLNYLSRMLQRKEVTGEPWHNSKSQQYLTFPKDLATFNGKQTISSCNVQKWFFYSCLGILMLMFIGFPSTHTKKIEKKIGAT